MIKSISERAQQFHRDYPICDMLGLNLTHPRFVADDIDLGQRQDSCRADFVKLAEWGISVVMCKGGVSQYDYNFLHFWKDDPTWRPGRPDAEDMFLTLSVKNSTQIVLAILDRFLINVEENPDKVLLVRRRGDIAAAKAQGKIAVLMGANRSDWFGDSPGVLRMFARLGLRMITIGQSGRELGYDSSDEIRSGGKLTSLGVRMIEEMNANGILIDLAHTNDVCALDIIELSKTPVVDTHSNPRALEDGLRSTPDEVMKALAARGGLLGLTPSITRPPNDALRTEIDPDEVDTALTNIRYAVDVMGIDHVGIGTHFHTTCLPWLTDGILQAGFSDEDAAKILGGNYLRVLDQVLPE